ncbi:MAG: hypothetical protein GY850_38020 [bacterium]|nr:hypothetical protein [bacterium]
MGVQRKKQKVRSHNTADLSRGGGSYCSSAVDMAKSRWQSGDPDFALDIIMRLTSKFPRHEPAHRLMLRILIEEGYYPRDIVGCLDRIKKLGRFRPRDKVEYGIRKFELSHFKKALPLLEKAGKISPHLIMGWGYEPRMIARYAQICRAQLGLLLQEAGSSPRAVRKTLLKMAGHSQVDDGMKRRMTKLAKLCEYVPNTSKTAHLLELLKISKEKVLVFSRFTATLEEIAQRLSESGINFSMFRGKMSAAEKDRAVGNFRNGTSVMLCSEIGGE